MTDVVDQTAVGPLLKTKPKHDYATAGGIGSRINGLKIGADSDSMISTNRNAYLLGLEVDGSSSIISVPFKDPTESRESRVDSRVFYTSMSLNLNPNLKTEFSYDSTHGYLIEGNETSGTRAILFPNLSFETIDFSTSYVFNSEHASFLFSPMVFKRGTNSSSWVVGGSLRRYVLGGVSSAFGYPGYFHTNLNDATIYSLSAGGGYSITRFFKNWFTGGALSVFYDLNWLNKRYVGAPTQEEGSWTASSLINLAGGYAWDKLIFGVFITSRTWSLEIDRTSVSNNQGRMGMYLSYLF